MGERSESREKQGGPLDKAGAVRSEGETPDVYKNATGREVSGWHGERDNNIFRSKEQGSKGWPNPNTWLSTRDEASEGTSEKKKQEREQQIYVPRQVDPHHRTVT